MPPPGLQRRAFGAGIACVAGALAMPTLGALNRPELTRVLLAASGGSALSNLPLTIAAQLGYFESAGLQVEFTDALEEPQVQQADIVLKQEREAALKKQQVEQQTLIEKRLKEEQKAA